MLEQLCTPKGSSPKSSRYANSLTACLLDHTLLRTSRVPSKCEQGLSQPRPRHVHPFLCLQALSKGVFGNPHSQHNDLLDSAAAEDEARRLTLSMCNASAAEYECIFTSGATGPVLVRNPLPSLIHSRKSPSQADRTHSDIVATLAGAIKLVADSFPWTSDSKFVYSKDNHTSVLGVREVAQSLGASAESIAAPTLGGICLSCLLASSAVKLLRSRKEPAPAIPDPHHRVSSVCSQ